MEESIIINIPKTTTQPAITITGEFISANHSRNHSYSFTISGVNSKPYTERLNKHTNDGDKNRIKIKC